MMANSSAHIDLDITLPVMGTWARDRDLIINRVAKALRAAPGGYLPADLVREPDNEHDPNAIIVNLVTAVDDMPVGYVPREAASRMAPVLDAGEHFPAAIYNVGPDDREYLRVWLGIVYPKSGSELVDMRLLSGYHLAQAAALYLCVHHDTISEYAELLLPPLAKGGKRTPEQLRSLWHGILPLSRHDLSDPAAVEQDDDLF